MGSEWQRNRLLGERLTLPGSMSDQNFGRNGSPVDPGQNDAKFGSSQEAQA